MNRDRLMMVAGLGATLALLVGGGVFMLSRQSGANDFAQCQSGTIGGGFEMLGKDFELTNAKSERVKDVDVFTKPSLLYFGYTYCPDVCPLDLVRNAEAAELLAETDIDVQPVFVTVDARRDTPEVMGQFTEAIDPRIIGLTGTQDEVDSVAKAWRVYYAINDDDDQEDYLVDHMTYTYLVLPEHGTVALFNRDTTPEEMAERTACFADNA